MRLIPRKGIEPYYSRYFNRSITSYAIVGTFAKVKVLVLLWLGFAPNMNEIIAGYAVILHSSPYLVREDSPHYAMPLAPNRIHSYA